MTAAPSADHAKSVSDGHLRSIVKAASWRATGTIDTFILSFIFTQSFKLAGSIAVTEVLTKIVLFYLHERIWNRIEWGRTAGKTKAAKAAPESRESLAAPDLDGPAVAGLAKS